MQVPAWAGGAARAEAAAGGPGRREQGVLPNRAGQLQPGYIPHPSAVIGRILLSDPPPSRYRSYSAVRPPPPPVVGRLPLSAPPSVIGRLLLSAL